MCADQVTARELAARHGLRRVGREWRGNCPACSYKDSLTLSERNGRPLWHCMNCNDQTAVTAALLGDRPAAVCTAPPKADDADARRTVALRLYHAAIESDLIDRWLRGRGLTRPSGAPLRLLREAKHPSGSRWPCMVALVVDVAGHSQAVHRTFLLPDGTGKAPVEPCRMTLGPVGGGAVHLWPAAPRLIVAEGIETAIAAAELLQGPAWAATSAGNLGDLMRLPAVVTEVVIAADNDAPGKAAAARAAARFRAEGRRVRIALPDRPGADFNDVLRTRGNG